MMKYVKKYKAIWIGMVLGCCFFFGIGAFEPGRLNQTDAKNAIGSYEGFSGDIYDENRLEPVDMMTLLKQWQGKTKQEHPEISEDLTSNIQEKVPKTIENKKGWRTIETQDQIFLRYYIEPDQYLIGWQYVSCDEVWDWYYFDTKTGYMITDTIIDGVVLSDEGYALAVTATEQETLQQVESASHCKEVLLGDTIYTTEQIEVSKDLLLVGLKDQVAEVKSNKGNKANEAVVRVSQEAVLTLASNVEINTNGNKQTGIQITDHARLDCHGTVGDLQKQQAEYAIAAMGEDARVCIYPDGVVTGANIGIYSQGETILVGNRTENSLANLKDCLLAFCVQAAEVSTGQSITGNATHGILQDGGTLTMSGGQIYDNGTLGDNMVVGSFGGGVCLQNDAVMNMTGGTISANKASYGGGIYVDSGCTLNLYGGTIGGTEKYLPSGTNTAASGNYAQEGRTAATSMCYAYGGGGGICSRGIVNIPATFGVTIANNCTKGSIGGGGILIIDGNTHISGNVTIHKNQTYASEGSQDKIYGKDDRDGEGAGIRIGTEDTSGTIVCTINCQNATDFPQVDGTLMLRDNISSGDGGGIFVSEKTAHQLVIKGDASICKNTSQSQGGGGIKSNGGSVFLYGTNIYSNVATSSIGGGVAGAGTVDLENCNIYNNSSGTGGGGVAIFVSPEGVTGNGYVHGCNVYSNTSETGGSGVDVQNGATGRLQGSSLIHQNKKGLGAVYCDSASKLNIGVCSIYDNENYGVYNVGTAVVVGSPTIGFSTYNSTADYVVAQNQTGGFYNQGSLTVNGSKMFYIYGGDRVALHNAGGSVLFKKSSSNRFYGKDGTRVVWNQGTMNAKEKGLLGSALVMIAGDNVDYGLDNDGGTLYWKSDIRGNYEIEDNSMSQISEAKGLSYGCYNRNDGEIYLTGGNICDCINYGIYCERESQLHMAEAAAVDAGNAIFLDEGCQIDINGALTATGVIAVLDTRENGDRTPGRIMANVSYSGGTGKEELYDADGNQRFLLAYDKVDAGTIALLLDGSNIQGISETVALSITEADIYLSTEIVEQIDCQLEAWLYDWSAWLRNQMQGNKKDEKYQYFMAGDTGVITFTSRNLTQVSILWPNDGEPDQLKTYDVTGSNVMDQSYTITELTEDIAQIYENNSYQFQVPVGTPQGVYYVTVIGTNEEGETISCVLPVNVGDQTISATFRTRIR